MAVIIIHFGCLSVAPTPTFLCPSGCIIFFRKDTFYVITCYSFHYVLTMSDSDLLSN